MNRGMKLQTTIYLDRGDELAVTVAGTVHVSRYRPGIGCYYEVDDLRVVEPAGLVLTALEDEQAVEALQADAQAEHEYQHEVMVEQRGERW